MSLNKSSANASKIANSIGHRELGIHVLLPLYSIICLNVPGSQAAVQNVQQC